MGQVPNFKPSKQGLPYANNWGHYPDITIRLPKPFGSLRIGDASNGLCGGMVFAVRDLYEAQRLPPSGQPQEGSPAFRFLVERLFTSFDIPDGVLKYYTWMNLPAHDTVLGPHGTSWLTIRDVMPVVRRSIDNGHPSPLGLILIHSSDPTLMGKNHQVLAWAYRDAGNTTTVRIYDPDAPGDDNANITFDHSNPNHTTNFQYSGGSHLYGFFTVPYRSRKPDPLFESKA